MDMGLAGRTALIGGASAGLGRASAERLAAEGCRLALWSRGGEALERAAGEIRLAHSVEVTTISGDAADPSTRRWSRPPRRRLSAGSTSSS